MYGKDMTIHILMNSHLSASFWFGDLNFRIEGDQEEVKKKIDEGDLKVKI